MNTYRTIIVIMGVVIAVLAVNTGFAQERCEGITVPKSKMQKIEKAMIKSQKADKAVKAMTKLEMKSVTYKVKKGLSKNRIKEKTAMRPKTKVKPVVKSKMTWG
jgi:hypothetical protein